MANWNLTSLADIGRYTTLSADYYSAEYAEADARFKKIEGSVVPLRRCVQSIYPITYGVLKPREVNESGFRMARIQNSENLFIFGDDLPPISPEQFEEYHRSEVREGDIVIAIGGYIGPLGIICTDDGNRININRHLARISPDSSRVEPYYLLTFLASKTSQSLLAREVRGAVQAGINLADLKLQPIFLPSRIQQIEVAGLVKSAETSVRSARSLYSQAQDFLESELGLDVMRFDRSIAYGTRFSTAQHSEAFEAHRIDAQCFSPEALFYEKLLSTQATCDRLATLLSSVVKGRQQTETEHGFADYCSIKNIFGREIVDASKTSPGKGTPTAKSDDLLLAITGATIGKIGIVKRYEELAFSGDMLRLRAKPEINPHYLLLVLDHHLGQVQFNRWITGSTNGHLSPRDVGRVLVPRLPPEKENEIAALVEQSIVARQESEMLLEQAKARVEQLIEEAVAA